MTASRIPLAARLLPLLLGFAVLPPSTARGADLPSPPCGGAVQPPLTAPGAPPAMQAWSESQLSGWRPPACLGWRGQRSRMVAALSAEIRTGDSLGELLDRLGAFSAYPTIPYWSASRRAWQPLANRAGLVGGGSDLYGDAFRNGASYGYFEESGSRHTTYRLTVLERSDRRAVIEIENTSTISWTLLPLFDPGSLQSTLFLERTGPDRWAWYHAMRAGDGASLLAANGTESALNHLAAFHRYIAGRPAPAVAQH
ncbi:MAG TPA: DUF6675 family protein [Acetobacteraceae bacterium]|nr:DUF6675 family protein [Acetobacteraceae bacterium]